MSDTMTREELISLTIDKYTDLQRIKKANGDNENKELDYQLKVTVAKLSLSIPAPIEPPVRSLGATFPAAQSHPSGGGNHHSGNHETTIPVQRKS